MSDRRLAEARYLATCENSLETLLHLELELERAGEKAEETFYPILQAYSSEIELADAAYQGILNLRSEAADEEYVKRYGASLKCALCRGCGWIRHFDTDFPCNCSGEPTYQPDYFKLREIRDSIDLPQLKEASVRLNRLRKEHAERLNATRIGIGALVQYSNERAKAKFKETNEPVEYYTLGIVTKIFTAGSFRHHSVEKAGVDTFDGYYETAVSNLEPRVLNAWARYRGYDAEGQRKAKILKEMEEDTAILEERFGVPVLRRRMRVKVHGCSGVIVWTGRDTKTGRMRVGFKVGANPDRRDSATFIDAVECMPL